MLIDMQIMRVANPSVDLVYMLYSSSNNDARKENLNDWLKIYHDTLIDDLKTLGYPESVYPFEDLEKDIDHARLFGVIMGLMHCQVDLNIIFHQSKEKLLTLCASIRQLKSIFDFRSCKLNLKRILTWTV